MIHVEREGSARARRREAVENARAIVGFAGGEVSVDLDALNERYISGEITIDQAVAECLRPGK